MLLIFAQNQNLLSYGNQNVGCLHFKYYSCLFVCIRNLTPQWLCCTTIANWAFRKYLAPLFLINSQLFLSTRWAAVFWNSKGVVLTYYIDDLRKLRADIAKKCSGRLCCGILFHRDNSAAHFSRVRNEGWENFGGNCCDSHHIVRI